MFEDDYTLSGGKSVFPNLGCCCSNHMEILQKHLGENITHEQMRRYVLDCGENRYRQAWLDVMGETLRSFTQKIERFLHSIDKEVRIGLSANGSSFNVEGDTFPRPRHFVPSSYLKIFDTRIR